MSTGPYGDADGPFGGSTVGGSAPGQSEPPAYPGAPTGQSGYPVAYPAAPGYQPAQPYPPTVGGPQPGYAGGPAGYPAAYSAGVYAPGAMTYGAYPAPRNGLGTAALVLGIIGVVLCWIPFTGWALNILAVIFGAIGRKRAINGEANNKSSAVAGLVLGVVGLAVWVVIVIFAFAAFNQASTTIGSYNS